jgi:hypothetical protein
VEERQGIQEWPRRAPNQFDAHTVQGVGKNLAEVFRQRNLAPGKREAEERERGFMGK